MSAPATAPGQRRVWPLFTRRRSVSPPPLGTPEPPVAARPALPRRGLRLNVVLPATLLAVAMATPMVAWALSRPDYLWPLLSAAGFAVAWHLRDDVARTRLSAALLDELPKTATRYALALGAVVFIAEYVGTPVWDVRRLTLELALSGALGLVARAVTLKVLGALRRRGQLARRCLVIGGGAIGTSLIRSMRAHPEFGLVPVGVVDQLPCSAADEDIPHLGTLPDLPRLIVDSRCDVLVVAFGISREREVVDFLWSSYGYRCDLFVVPRLFEVTAPDTFDDHVAGIPVIRVRRGGRRSVDAALKRVFDLAFAGTALLVLLPLLAAVAAAVRSTGPGVIFRQPRIGKDGRTFDLLKFRSMQPVTSVDSATTWNVVGDPRVTRVGRLLRKTSLDELPQLWNILRGQMTLVGPRPERPVFVDRFSVEVPGYSYRHRVPVGLTGLAQVSGLRGDSSIALRARYDNYYIEHWSLWTDVKVIIRTVREVVGARGG